MPSKQKFRKSTKACEIVRKKTVFQDTMKRRDVSIQISPRRKIACEEYSKGDRSKSSKFIAIHGWLDNCATWRNFVPDFIEKMGNDATFLCIDLAGHGNSSHRDSRTYLLTDYVIDVYRVVQTLGWKRFGLVGRTSL